MKQRSLILSCTALGIIGGVTAAISLFGFDAQAQDMSLKKKGPTPALLPAPAPGLPPISIVGGGTTWCGTKPPTALQKQRDLQAMANLRRRPVAGRGPGTVIVPVYFHVISRTDGTGNVPDSALHAQIKVLNMAYAGKDTPATHAGQGLSAQETANTAFRFVLGTAFTRTPNGTPIVNGISRTVSNAWHTLDAGTSAESSAKAALKVGRGGTLNIYICDGGPNYLGYAYYPYPDSDSFPLDGAIVDYITVPGSSDPVYKYGDVAVHEVGHWLGLYHTFEGGCVSDAVNGGDVVSDTPAEREAFFGRVPPTRDSCTGPGFTGRDPAENFMDYTDPDCMFQFTPGQAARADDQHFLYRMNP